MTRLDEYGKTYPDLVWDIWLFFELHNPIKSLFINELKKNRWNPDFAPKCTLDCSKHLKNKYKEIGTTDAIQPRTISKICDRLCENNLMSKVKIGSLNGFDEHVNFYQTMLKKPKSEIIGDKELLSRYLNNLVYGFPYIYENNKKNVRPIWVKKNGQLSNGTCFNSILGIVTAKHCIDDCDEIQIDSIDADVLKSAKIFGSEEIDLVLIQPQSDYRWSNKFITADGAVLDEIMVMGYPNHSGFDRFLTATTGEIAAIEKPYLAKYNLMLLTGKIKGGNSGGPVLNNNGKVVGIITEMQNSEGDYDKFGYGMAIPSSYLEQLVEIENNYNFVNKIS
ncbi:MAG: serine protease [Alistipes senegalensis]|nr:serine protease [Oxalobacter formigenes]MCM1280951.1 serine protease [Alistipes senegalensis]